MTPEEYRDIRSDNPVIGYGMLRVFVRKYVARAYKDESGTAAKRYYNGMDIIGTTGVIMDSLRDACAFVFPSTERAHTNWDWTEAGGLTPQQLLDFIRERAATVLYNEHYQGAPENAGDPAEVERLTETIYTALCQPYVREDVRIIPAH